MFKFVSFFLVYHRTIRHQRGTLSNIVAWLFLLAKLAHLSFSSWRLSAPNTPLPLPHPPLLRMEADLVPACCFLQWHGDSLPMQASIPCSPNIGQSVQWTTPELYNVPNLPYISSFSFSHPLHLLCPNPTPLPPSLWSLQMLPHLLK